ncbi:hypothetical protein ZOSMA_181G00130 [Zostera marina]|uniref:Uncharacterized protein n=1 Tax=Zostera marina TaxID=29655 RepID=A0A0K9PQN3_ZOSMR|nr:hypothetical protein ZOSMA_181G00130 [Zostera marina]
MKKKKATQRGINPTSKRIRYGESSMSDNPIRSAMNQLRNRNRAIQTNFPEFPITIRSATNMNHARRSRGSIFSNHATHTSLLRTAGQQEYASMLDSVYSEIAQPPLQLTITSNYRPGSMSSVNMCAQPVLDPISTNNLRGSVGQQYSAAPNLQNLNMVARPVNPTSLSNFPGSGGHQSGSMHESLRSVSPTLSMRRRSRDQTVLNQADRTSLPAQVEQQFGQSMHQSTAPDLLFQAKNNTAGSYQYGSIHESTRSNLNLDGHYPIDSKSWNHAANTKSVGRPVNFIPTTVSEALNMAKGALMGLSRRNKTQANINGHHQNHHPMNEAPKQPAAAKRTSTTTSDQYSILGERLASLYSTGDWPGNTSSIPTEQPRYSKPESPRHRPSNTGGNPLGRTYVAAPTRYCVKCGTIVFPTLNNNPDCPEKHQNNKKRVVSRVGKQIHPAPAPKLKPEPAPVASREFVNIPIKVRAKKKLPRRSISMGSVECSSRSTDFSMRSTDYSFKKRSWKAIGNDLFSVEDAKRKLIKMAGEMNKIHIKLEQKPNSINPIVSAEMILDVHLPTKVVAAEEHNTEAPAAITEVVKQDEEENTEAPAAITEVVKQDGEENTEPPAAITEVVKQDEEENTEPPAAITEVVKQDEEENIEAPDGEEEEEEEIDELSEKSEPSSDTSSGDLYSPDF